jgi:hypothetical protein
MKENIKYFENLLNYRKINIKKDEEKKYDKYDEIENEIKNVNKPIQSKTIQYFLKIK